MNIYHKSYICVKIVMEEPILASEVETAKFFIYLMFMSMISFNFFIEIEKQLKIVRLFADVLCKIQSTKYIVNKHS